MKTLDEAMTVLRRIAAQVPEGYKSGMKGLAPDVVSIQELITECENNPMVVSLCGSTCHELACGFVDEVVNSSTPGMFDGNAAMKLGQMVVSIAMTSFAYGVRVGMEMEKTL